MRRNTKSRGRVCVRRSWSGGGGREEGFVYLFNLFIYFCFQPLSFGLLVNSSPLPTGANLLLNQTSRSIARLLLRISWGFYISVYVKRRVVFSFFSTACMRCQSTWQDISYGICGHMSTYISFTRHATGSETFWRKKNKGGVETGEPWRSMDCGNTTEVLLASLLLWKNSAAQSKLPADTIKYRQQPACYTHAYTAAAANPQRLS